MAIKQISIFLENTTGRLGEVTATIAKADINIRAISIADTADFGILRLIVNDYEKAVEVLNSKGFTDYEKAVEVLNSKGFTTRVSDVAVVEIEDKPGSLAKLMELFQKLKINIEYLYASLEGKAAEPGASGKAVIIFKLENHEKGMNIINENGLRIVESF